MGYDMYWKEEPAEVAEAYAAVSAANGYDKDVYERWFSAQDRTGSYFRLNIFGMGRYRTYMTERGMLNDAAESGPYPEHEAFGVSAQEYDDYPEDEAVQTPAFRAWREAVEVWRGEETGGVMPTYKFCSNDGWVVTPKEITRSLEALERWERAQRDLHGQSWIDPLRHEDDGYWDKWIRFLYCARSHGGVIVR